MQLLNIHGELVTVDVRPSKYPIRAVSKSKLQGIAGEHLTDRFPNSPVLEEFTIPGSKLSVDFFLPIKKIAVEVQGIQHKEHSVFFHGDRKLSLEYGRQKSRDRQKANWCEINGFKMIEVFTEEDLEQI